MKVTFKDVTMSYDGKTDTLKDLNFTIPDGTLVSLLGPSGGGKTTTLNLISGLLSPTAGQIFFGDTDVTKKDALARKVGMVFQNYSLYPHLSVLDNIAFPLKMAKVSKAERHAKAKDLAKLVHVEDQLDKKPGALSGGQQQRVAIGRALVTRPALILADEPTGNLDSKNSQEVLALLQTMSAKYQQTILMITHNKNHASAADRIFNMSDGVLKELGVSRK